MNAITAFAKGHIALVGFALTLITALWPHSHVAHVVSVILGVAATTGVYVAPNRRAGRYKSRQAGYSVLELVFAVFVLIILVLLIIFLAQKIH